MWRKCDLHIHTWPNERSRREWDPEEFVASRIAAGYDVVAVTDHDSCERVDDLIDLSAGSGLQVIPGVEISTDRGHLLVLAPGSATDVIKSFIQRIGCRPNSQVAFDSVMEIARCGDYDSRPWMERLVFIGAHVDLDRSLLARTQSLNVERQLELASGLNALEVTNVDTRTQWVSAGVKDRQHLTLVSGSDFHGEGDEPTKYTWIYLPSVAAPDLQHALAIPEASVRFEGPKPEEPNCWIEKIEFDGGLHHGLSLTFCERANAIIGPPNSGKSLLVDAIRFVFDLKSAVAEVEATSNSRRAKCLPPGASVTVHARLGERSLVLTRLVGGRPPELPFRPIVFSQTELTRRAGERVPSVDLLDLHVPNAPVLRSRVTELGAVVKNRFLSLVSRAELAQRLRRSVENPVDGLARRRAMLRDLAGADSTIREAAVLAQVAAWRGQVAETLRLSSASPEIRGPALPIPSFSLSGDVDVTDLVPNNEIQRVMSDAVAASRSAIVAGASRANDILDASQARFVERDHAVQQELVAAGAQSGSDLYNTLRELRNALEQLEAENQRLQEVDSEIDSGLTELRDQLTALHQSRAELTESRRSACRLVNDSMRSFYVRIEPEASTHDLDSRIKTAAQGTYLRDSSLRIVRDRLDRPRLLERAVRQVQGRGGGVVDDQDRIVDDAIRRGRAAELADVACT
jgi:hypothetical protein